MYIYYLMQLFESYMTCQEKGQCFVIKKRSPENLTFNRKINKQQQTMTGILLILLSFKCKINILNTATDSPRQENFSKMLYTNITEVCPLGTKSFV